MPKITPSALIQSMSGKVCAHSDTYFATNKQTGNVYAVKVCHPNTAHPNDAQIATRVAFAHRSALVKQWFAQNKPNDSNPQGTAEYQDVKARFKAQHKIGSIAGFVSKYIQEDGTVGSNVSSVTAGSVPSDGNATGSGSNTPATGGASGDSSEIG